jgi:hypothetical protein
LNNNASAVTCHIHVVALAFGGSESKNPSKEGRKAQQTERVLKHMAEEVWSGSSLGSSFMNEDDEISHQSSLNQLPDTTDGQLRNTLVDRELQLVTEKYLSRRDGDSINAQSAVPMTSSGDNNDNNDLSFDRSSSPSHFQEAHASHEDNHYAQYQKHEEVIAGEYAYTEQKENVNENPASSLHYSNDSDGSHDMMELLLPSFVRVNKLMNENGCLTLSVTAADIDVENRSISVFVLDSWAESITNFVAENLEHQQNSLEKVVDASFEVQRNDISISNLDVEVHHLQEKLRTAKEKEKNLRMKSSQSGLCHLACLFLFISNFLPEF